MSDKGVTRFRNSERDWPEDFSGENGKYQCLCIYCEEYFLGHKRRFVCKRCDHDATSLATAQPPAAPLDA